MEKNRITSIEKQKNRPRYNIYIDEVYAFSVHEDILIKYRLGKGKEIEPQDVTEVLHAEEKHRAEQYALRYISFRPRTSYEVYDYLKTKGFEEEDCKITLESCVEKGYINDRWYASQWIDERKRLKPRGRHLLRQELIQRGLTDDLIEDALGEQLSVEEEKTMVVELIKKKFRGQRFSTLYDMKKKIIPYLQRKGFSLDLILSSMQEVQEAYIGENQEEENYEI